MSEVFGDGLESARRSRMVILGGVKGKRSDEVGKERGLCDYRIFKHYAFSLVQAGRERLHGQAVMGCSRAALERVEGFRKRNSAD